MMTDLETPALLTDRYQLAMLVGYARSGLAIRRAACELFVRRLPKERPYMVVAGIERAVDAVRAIRFGAREVAYLKADPRLGPAITPEVEAYLRDFRFRGDIRAMPEGTVAFANEPLVRVEAALPEAQLVETLLLSILNHDARVATKAARVVQAAEGRPCFEFGSRRTHERAAVDAAVAACTGGFVGTSNEAAGLLHGVPVAGTCAHMWTLAFAEEGEEESFRAYARAFPSGTVFLVDTYDTPRGIDRAIRAVGATLGGVRIDSGDLAALSIDARARLDRAGLTSAKVILSGDLSEYKIRSLLGRGARVDQLGVGTDVVATPDAPSLGAVYKLVEVEGARGRMVPVAKASEGKATRPGRKQVLRGLAGGVMTGDRVVLADEEAVEVAASPGLAPLLETFVAGGERVRPLEAPAARRARSLAQVASLPAALRAIPSEEERLAGTWTAPAAYPVEASQALARLFEEAIAKGGAS